jgi:hypothetical protein
MKDAQRYERLAALLVARYPRVRASTLKSWIRYGLVPEARIDHVGFGLRTFSEPPRVVEQLLAVCGYRYDHRIRDLRLVAGLIWLDGFAVEERFVRTALMRALDVVDQVIDMTNRRSGETDLKARIDESALVVAHDAAAATAKLDGDLMARGISDFVAAFLGVQVEGDWLSREEGFRELAKALGLYGIVGVKPSEVVEGAATTYPKSVFLTIIGLATLADLDLARARAPALVEEVSRSLSRHGSSGVALPDFHAIWFWPRTRLIAVLMALAAKDLLSMRLANATHSG